MSFQKISLMVATIFLVLMLGLIAFMLYKAKSQVQYPPDIAECPDYWTVSGNGVCNNVKNLGTNCQSPMDFSGPEWQGDSGLSAKYHWANACRVTWDGITNNSKFASPTTRS